MLAFAVAGSAQAEIYKCQTPAGTAYQATPCLETQQSEVLAIQSGRRSNLETASDNVNGSVEVDTDGFYPPNVAATALNFAETIGESFEDLNEVDYNRLLIKAMTAAGYDGLNAKVLSRSIGYHFIDSDPSEYPGYSAPFPDVDL